MKEVSVAIIGAGYIADFHTRALKLCPGVVIKAVCSARAQSARAFAQKHGIELATTEMVPLLARNDIDAAVMGIPNKFHAPYTIEWLKSGKDVFQDKPLAMSADEGLEIMAVARECGGLVMVGHMWRFDEQTCYIEKVVRSGRIGRVFKAKAYGIHVDWGPAGWFTQKRLAGGGALIDMGVHAIDTVRFIMGDPKPVGLYAKVGTHLGDYDVDDTGVMMIDWDNGATTVIESGWWQPHMDGPEAATRIYGTEGYASLYPTLFKSRIEGVAGEFKPRFEPKPQHCDLPMYTRQMAHFIDCVRTRQTPKPGLAEGQVVMEIVDAAYRSSQTGQVVEVVCGL